MRAGDRWGFAVRLKRPRGLLNPGGFDYERYLYAKGIVATGTIHTQPPPRLLAEADRYPLDRYRQRVADSFERLLPGNPYAGILIALAVGEEGGITPWQWDVFNRVGVGHLMSISGSHIGLIAGLAFALAWGFWSRVPTGRCAGPPPGRRRWRRCWEQAAIPCCPGCRCRRSARF